MQDDCTTRLHALNEHLVEIGSLCTTYTTYQMSFNKLLLEVARRRQYKEAAEHIVRGMMEQLHAMTEGTALCDYMATPRLQYHAVVLLAL